MQKFYFWNSKFQVFERSKSRVFNIFDTPIFIAVLSTTAKTWMQPKFLSTDEWMNIMWYDTYNVILFSSKKEVNSDSCDKINGPLIQYAKWNVRHTHNKKQILYNFTNMATYYSKNHRDRKIGGCQSEWNGELFNGDEVSVLQDEPPRGGWWWWLYNNMNALILLTYTLKSD